MSFIKECLSHLSSLCFFIEITYSKQKHASVWYNALTFPKWHFFTKIVLTYCEKKNLLVIEKNFWSCKIFEISRTIYSNSERSEQLLVTECFLTCSWTFLMFNKLKQFKFNLGKIIGIYKHAGKVGKFLFYGLMFPLFLKVFNF